MLACVSSRSQALQRKKWEGLVSFARFEVITGMASPFSFLTTSVCFLKTKLFGYMGHKARIQIRVLTLIQHVIC